MKEKIKSLLEYLLDNKIASYAMQIGNKSFRIKCNLDAIEILPIIWKFFIDNYDIDIMEYSMHSKLSSKDGFDYRMDYSFKIIEISE